MKNSLAMFSAIESLGAVIDLNELNRVVKAAQGIEGELNTLASFSSQHYTRTSVYRADGFEALLLCWEPGQRTPLHNHKGSCCVVRVLQGTATEIVYKHSNSGLLFPVVSHECTVGQSIASYDSDIHQMANLGSANMVTLHIYAPALTKMELLSLDNTCHAGYDEVLSKSSCLKTESISLIN